MDQNGMLIELKNFTNKDKVLFGNVDGKRIFLEVQECIEAHPESKIIGVSLAGIKATDASFPRESIISLAKMYKGEKGFYICDCSEQDMLDNWDYAAQAKLQSMIVKVKKGYQVIGPQLTETSKELLDFIMKRGEVTTAMVAAKFDISTQNASARLRKLYDQGLVLGTKEAAETGGLEFLFTAIE